MLIAGSEDADLLAVLSSLAARRPVFHSERDFQFELAWEVRTRVPDVRVYLEPRPSANVHLDLAFEHDGAYSALELKYLTRHWDGTDPSGQSFTLTNQGALDYGRYGGVRDVTRIESFLRSRPGSNGAAIALTNDSGYWRQRATTARDAAFRIAEGQKLHRELRWSSPPSSKKHDHPLSVAGLYELSWSNYSAFGGPDGIRQLVIEVNGPSIGN
ncbi:hypothetical protein [Schumannella sp. 10F1B-5-1]|uniref:hypothetical protein n=1 Tax=Schumannella sp. 10F1B-5-1 TaxID=2590780 RepID=UPI001130B238|nr:hypothetical protein [Schumannella sp. 10F1B-5-1]TPW73830.1 hypothetical protein FJ658_04235 [Schumannella sp. 10F1B-5-1]